MSLMFEKVMPLARELNGIWYSTEEEGECKGEQRPGDGTCFWRLVENTRVVNASCGESSDAPPASGCRQAILGQASVCRTVV